MCSYCANDHATRGIPAGRSGVSRPPSARSAVDLGGDVGRAVDRRAGDEHVRTGLRDAADRVARDARRPPGSTSSPPDASIAARARRIFGSMPSMNDWPPNPGSTVITSTMSNSGSRSSSGSTGDAGRSAIPARDAARPQLAGQPHGRLRRLGVERHGRRAGRRVLGRPAVGVLDHQVHVERHRRDLRRSAHDRQAEREVGHEVVVHDVDVHEVGGRDRLEVALEVDEVGGQDARVDQRRHPASRRGRSGRAAQQRQVHRVGAVHVRPQLDVGAVVVAGRRRRPARCPRTTARASIGSTSTPARPAATQRVLDDELRLDQVRRARHVGDDAAGAHRPQRRDQQVALQRAQRRPGRRACGASAPPDADAARRARCTARRPSPGRRRRARRCRPCARRRSARPRPRRRAPRAAPARPAGCGAAAPRWRRSGRRAPPRRPRAAPPCRRGRRTGRASARRGRRAVPRSARARPAGCPRPAPRRGRRGRSAAPPGRRRPGRPPSARARRACDAVASSSTTSSVAARPGRATRVTRGATLSATSSASISSAERPLPTSASRSARTTHSGWLWTTASARELVVAGRVGDPLLPLLGRLAADRAQDRVDELGRARCPAARGRGPTVSETAACGGHPHAEQLVRAEPQHVERRAGRCWSTATAGGQRDDRVVPALQPQRAVGELGGERRVAAA